MTAAPDPAAAASGGGREAARAFVRAMIARDVLRFGDFVLKSGRRAPCFFNLGAIADGAGYALLGAAYAAETLRLPVRPDVLFGPAYKGIPIATAAAVALARDHGVPVSAAFDRKEAKSHGEGGRLFGAPLAGRTVVIVDDVVSDGAAKREAAGLIAAAGGALAGIVLALDRQDPAPAGGETAARALARTLDVPVRAVATMDDVLAVLASDPARADHHARLARYRAAASSAAAPTVR